MFPKAENFATAMRTAADKQFLPQEQHAYSALQAGVRKCRSRITQYKSVAEGAHK